MAKIIGNTTATPNPRPDWDQTDETKADYIKNKPISVKNTFVQEDEPQVAEYGDLWVQPPTITIVNEDVTFDDCFIECLKDERYLLKKMSIDEYHSLNGAIAAIATCPTCGASYQLTFDPAGLDGFEEVAWYVYQYEDGIAVLEEISTAEYGAFDGTYIDYTVDEVVLTDKTVLRYKSISGEWVEIDSNDGTIDQETLNNIDNRFKEVEQTADSAYELADRAYELANLAAATSERNSEAVGEIQTQMGDIETALDNIITIQESLIGGETA